MTKRCVQGREDGHVCKVSLTVYWHKTHWCLLPHWQSNSDITGFLISVLVSIQLLISKNIAELEDVVESAMLLSQQLHWTHPIAVLAVNLDTKLCLDDVLSFTEKITVPLPVVKTVLDAVKCRYDSSRKWIKRCTNNIHVIKPQYALFCFWFVPK